MAEVVEKLFNDIPTEELLKILSMLLKEPGKTLKVTTDVLTEIIVNRAKNPEPST